jgi:hypothetical protein
MLCSTVGKAIYTTHHGQNTTNLYGIPPPGSPFHRPESRLVPNDPDFWNSQGKNIDFIRFYGGLRLDHYVEQSDQIIYFAGGAAGVGFLWTLVWVRL